MENIKAIIVEDEAPARELIMHYLKDHPRVQVIEQCQDGFEGAKAIFNLKPDLVFLDIQMPRITGFEMLEILEAEQLPVVIFTTAYDQFAIKAFECNALDYLLKPISRERFNQALDKALLKLAAPMADAAAIDKALEMDRNDKGFIERIVAKSGSGRINVIPQEDISCIEAMDDYVLINTTSKEEYLKKKTLKYFEEHLDPRRFLRVHRSCMVAIDAVSRIEAYSRDAWVAILISGKKIPVSKAGYSALRKTFDF